MKNFKTTFIQIRSEVEAVVVVWVAQAVVAAAAETDYTIWKPTNDKKKVLTRLGFNHRNLCTSPKCYARPTLPCHCQTINVYYVKLILIMQDVQDWKSLSEEVSLKSSTLHAVFAVTTL